jgi:hypothetical protein
MQHWLKSVIACVKVDLVDEAQWTIKGSSTVPMS